MDWVLTVMLPPSSEEPEEILVDLSPPHAARLKIIKRYRRLRNFLIVSLLLTGAVYILFFAVLTYL
jgi:hypothetical protein